MFQRWGDCIVLTLMVLYGAYLLLVASRKLPYHSRDPKVSAKWEGQMRAKILGWALVVCGVVNWLSLASKT